MNYIFDEVKRCIDNECYYAALALALTIPDVLGQHRTRVEKGTWNTYSSWFEEYVSPQYTYKPVNLPQEDQISTVMLSGKECYALRCQFLHSESFDGEDRKGNYYRFIPHIHHETRYMIRKSFEHEIELWFDVVELCEAIVSAGEEYYNNCSDKEALRKSIIYIDARKYGEKT